MGLRGDLVPLPPWDLDHDPAVPVGPSPVGVHRPDVRRCVNDSAAARLDATLVLVHGLVNVVVAPLGLLEGEGLDPGLVPLRLVALERRHIVGFPVAARLGHRLPAAQGIEGRDATVQGPGFEPLRDGRDRVGSVVHSALAQHQPRLVRPGAGMTRPCFVVGPPTGG